MSRFLARTLPAVVLPVALLLPVAAHAEKVVTRDPAGDVVTLVTDEDGAEEVVAAPEYARVDIVRTVVDHRVNRLRVSVRFRELGRGPFQFTVIRVVTPREKFDLFVERLGGKPIVTMSRGKKELECAGLRARVDRSTTSVTTTLPTACIATPRWVQVGVGAIAIDEDGSVPDVLATYADDGHRGTIRDNSIGKGPKVRRG